MKKVFKKLMMVVTSAVVISAFVVSQNHKQGAIEPGPNPPGAPVYVAKEIGPNPPGIAVYS